MFKPDKHIVAIMGSLTSEGFGRGCLKTMRTGEME